MTHKDINLQRVLVVAPLNTVLNWQVEFEKWLAVDDRLEVILSCFDIRLEAMQFVFTFSERSASVITPAFSVKCIGDIF